MKLIVVLSVLLAVALARPQKPGDAVIVEASNDNDGLGTYKFGFRTSDGIVRQEQGQLKNAGTENEAIEVRGSFTYKDDQGVEHTVNFVADENGYQPQVAN